MTISDSKKRLKEAIKKLNNLNKNLHFEIEEEDYCIGFICKSAKKDGCRFGAYEKTYFFDEYKKKTDAYIINAVMSAELILAAAKINDPKAYHNLIA